MYSLFGFDVGCGAFGSVSSCKSLPQLLFELLHWRSRTSTSRRARVAAQKPQAPQQGPRGRRQHGVGQPDAQRVVEEHRFRGPELLLLQHSLVRAQSTRGNMNFCRSPSNINKLSPNISLVKVSTRWWRNTAFRKPLCSERFQLKRASRYDS